MKTLITFIMLFTILSSYAADLTCITNNGSKTIVLKENGEIEIEHSALKQVVDARRSPSSFGDHSKEYHFIFEGEKHVLHLAPQAEISGEGDYLWVTSGRGHKLLYPISCS